mmetsp:Transcript_40533/g.102036  ORF Transcript_40533/g.102036 Transcript_40533/m.102036 type:complete len:293 (-) Transcript_40533:306-1184(-)
MVAVVVCNCNLIILSPFVLALTEFKKQLRVLPLLFEEIRHLVLDTIWRDGGGVHHFSGKVLFKQPHNILHTWHAHLPDLFRIVLFSFLKNFGCGGVQLEVLPRKGIVGNRSKVVLHDKFFSIIALAGAFGATLRQHMFFIWMAKLVAGPKCMKKFVATNATSPPVTFRCSTALQSFLVHCTQAEHLDSFVINTHDTLNFHSDGKEANTSLVIVVISFRADQCAILRQPAVRLVFVVLRAFVHKNNFTHCGVCDLSHSVQPKLLHFGVGEGDNAKSHFSNCTLKFPGYGTVLK